MPTRALIDKFPPMLHRPTGQYAYEFGEEITTSLLDPDNARAEWVRVQEDLLAGRIPRPL
jgi:hypothetical protein